MVPQERRSPAGDPEYFCAAPVSSVHTHTYIYIHTYYGYLYIHMYIIHCDFSDTNTTARLKASGDVL